MCPDLFGQCECKQHCIRTNVDGRLTTGDDGQRPITIAHLSTLCSGELKTVKSHRVIHAKRSFALMILVYNGSSGQLDMCVLQSQFVILQRFVRKYVCKCSAYEHRLDTEGCPVPGQLTPNHLTPESTHPIFGQLTLYMK